MDYCHLLRITHRLPNPQKKIRSDITHMWANQDSYPNYTHFVVPVRNPVDRLISWYNYELLQLQQGQNQAIRLKLLSKCYSTVNALISEGLVETSDDTNITKCQSTAAECLKGEYPCAKHNFYNYEMYLEDLLQWKNCFNSYSSQDPNDDCRNTTNIRDIRIDVIRTEQQMQDLQRILELWTSGMHDNTTTTEVNVSTWLVQENSAQTLDISRSKYVSSQGIQKLCRAICPELIAYKQILQFADNLHTHDVQDSFQSLDERCGLSVDKVCGVDFRFRNMKRQKGIVKDE